MITCLEEKKMYELKIVIDSKEKFEELFTKSEPIWHKVGVRVSPNNDVTKKFMTDMDFEPAEE